MSKTFRDVQMFIISLEDKLFTSNNYPCLATFFNSLYKYIYILMGVQFEGEQGPRSPHIGDQGLYNVESLLHCSALIFVV